MTSVGHLPREIHLSQVDYFTVFALLSTEPFLSEPRIFNWGMPNIARYVVTIGSGHLAALCLNGCFLP